MLQTRKWARSNKPEKGNQVLDAFFKPQAPLNPSTVSAPPPIRPGEPFALAPEHRVEPLAYPEPVQAPASPMAKSAKESTMVGGQSAAARLPDKRAVSLLQDLEVAVKQIPGDIPSATPEHRLSVFSVDPCTCVAEPGEDDWMILNQMMKSSFGWGEVEMAVVVPQLLNRGTHGLDGFVHFMRYFVHERGLQGALFETKVEVLLKEIGER
jgi:hypothetical protein